jgi:hypothetical protein
MDQTGYVRTTLGSLIISLGLVHFSLLAYGVVAFLHGGSPFKVWQPDSFRIRLNRRSTFNYGWDILSGDFHWQPRYQTRSAKFFWPPGF